MGLDGRVRHLERKGRGAVIRVICPECSRLFSVPALPLTEVIVSAWGGESFEEIHIHPAVQRLIDHEHDWEDFVEISGGRPLTDAGAPPVNPD